MTTTRSGTTVQSETTARSTPATRSARTARSAPDRLLAVLAAFDHEHAALSLSDIG
ncbi:IclR family transcriptional regulator, partial [Streptomyces sp. W16]|nr:IclR family transcriptional regulator [Streptomyces sp. W16]